MARRWRTLAVVLGAVLTGVALFWAITPHGPAASGCFWWTARVVGAATPGTRGCVRGYVGEGSALAEGPSPQDFALSFSTVDPDHTTKRSCHYEPGQAVVARYHSVFDCGRTLIVIDDCG